MSDIGIYTKINDEIVEVVKPKVDERIEEVQNNVNTLDSDVNTRLDSLKTEIDNDVVHKSGEETITGVKTFGQTGVRIIDDTSSKNNIRYVSQSNSYVKGDVPDKAWYAGVIAWDKDSSEIASCTTAVTITGDTQAFLYVRKPAPASTTSSSLGIGYNTSAAYTWAPTPSSASDNSTKIATTAWVRSATGNTSLNAATATSISSTTLTLSNGTQIWVS
jgi:hypothetical protein